MPTLLRERIRHARKAAKKTQAQVADQLGISREAVSLWESTPPPVGRGTAPSRENLIAFVSFIGCPWDWLTSDHSSLDWDPSQSAGRQRSILAAVTAVVDHVVDSSPVPLPPAVVKRAGELAVPIVERYTAEAIENGSALNDASAELWAALRQAKG